jgi:exodeoxyribonuclease-3
MLKVAAWNVNSLRMRCDQLIDWLAVERPDILALQETKVEDAAFPAARLQAAGYQSLYAGEKAYNGVALLSREPCEDICAELPGLHDPQRRLLSARYGGVRVVNVYVPNGFEIGSEKYLYKLRWLEHLDRYAAGLGKGQDAVILLGDFNIAPEDRDVHDPAVWEGKVLVSAPERAQLRRLLDAGFKDTFRLFPQEAGVYSWWDYRGGSFRRNHGLRIDLVLASEAFAAHCLSCRIDKAARRAPKPSDHAPVIAEFDVAL